MGTDTPTTMDYSYWVEAKMLTEGSERLVENTLGLVGEAGEVAEKIKKLIRDSTKVNQDEIIKELGDVVFYATALANYFEGSLEEVIEVNMDKLDSRERRGTLRGSGDTR
jgi:NTP pyrophosphatase (non-canonical NTP hydrolase)